MVAEAGACLLQEVGAREDTRKYPQCSLEARHIRPPSAEEARKALLEVIRHLRTREEALPLSRQKVVVMGADITSVVVKTEVVEAAAPRSTPQPRGNLGIWDLVLWVDTA